MDNNLDEKKCPVCGRPNLNKANKCWYCQSPLEEEKDTQQKSLLSDEDILNERGDESSFVKSSLEQRPNRSKEDAPEWLRRVRELIAAEKVEEEPDDEWQQQQLFEISKGKQEHKGSPKSMSTDDKSNDTNQDIETDELPDGFTPFSDQPRD